MRPSRCASLHTAALLLTFAVAWALLVDAARAQGHSGRRTPPGVPVGVVAVPLRDAAMIAWLLPDIPQNASATTTYTITAYDTAVPSAVVATMKAEAPGTEISGLIGNHCYAFRVRAANFAGSSPDSDPSEPICLPPASGADLEVTVSAPHTATPGSDVTFTLLVKNNGAGDAPMVTLEDSLISPFASYNTSQGICQSTGGAVGLRCNLGTIYAGATATVTVDVSMGTTDLTMSAGVNGLDASGAILEDPVPDNNKTTASIHPQPE